MNYSYVDRPRYSCALGGALFAMRALPKTVPIIHASAGCGFNVFNAGNPGAGYIGGGYCGGTTWSSTNVLENEVVFGGADRLKEQIRTTLEILEGDLYVVVSGCMVEIVGDDIEAVTNEFAGENKTILAVPTPSFKGNSYEGYDLLLSGLFRSYLKKSLAKDKKVVNVFGLVPGQDPFYKGNLAEIKRLLSLVGLKVNTFFGEGETLEDLKNSSSASLNIVLSDVYGLKSAKVFKEVHSTEYISHPFPIGPDQTRLFLETVAKALGISSRIVKKVLSTEDERYFDYLERVADIYNDVDLQRYAIVVGDANYGPSVSRFLADELGWLPRLSVITDFLEDEQLPILESRFDNWESEIRPVVKFSPNTSDVGSFIREAWPESRGEIYYDSLTPTVVVGSVYERDLASKYGFPLLTVSFPVANRVVLNQAYAGYNGGLSLTSDLLSLLVAGR